MNEALVPTRLLGDVLWQRAGETSLEHCRLSELPEAFALQGCVLALDAGQPMQVQYVVHCAVDWSTRGAHVHIIRGDAVHRLELRRDEAGAWWRDDEPMPELEGLTDIDLSISPSTNTLPIRRLALPVGDSAATDAAWVRFPELTVQRLPQRYTRTAEHRYTYESRGGSFRADLEVDAHGLVVHYGQIWKRVGT